LEHLFASSQEKIRLFDCLFILVHATDLSDFTTPCKSFVSSTDTVRDFEVDVPHTPRFGNCRGDRIQALPGGEASGISRELNEDAMFSNTQTCPKQCLGLRWMPDSKGDLRILRVCYRGNTFWNAFFAAFGEIFDKV